MRVLGVDMGNDLAWAVVEDQVVLTAGRVSVRALAKELGTRIILAVDDLFERHAAEAWQYAVVAYEAPIVSCGKKSGGLAMARWAGVLISRSPVRTFEVNPTDVKRAATGSGKASKEQMVNAVTNHVVGARSWIEEAPAGKRHHLADAIAIAITAERRLQFERRLDECR